VSLQGAPLPVALGLAVLLGLRHASDPDHLVAMTALLAGERQAARRAVRVGAFWGVGHAVTLLALGLPLVVARGALPAWLESGAERAVGILIVALALRVLYRWATDRSSGKRMARTPHEAVAIGAVHGLAGTGPIVVLLLAALPTRGQAALALAVFAPMSILSMAACTAMWSWFLTRSVVEPLYRSLIIPALGAFGLVFGVSYAGLA
jgi:energy-converting hydrogenase Eha subunit E